MKLENGMKRNEMREMRCYLIKNPSLIRSFQMEKKEEIRNLCVFHLFLLNTLSNIYIFHRMIIKLLDHECQNLRSRK